MLQEKAEGRLQTQLELDAAYPGDSLSFVEFVMDLEDALGIDLPEEEVVATQTVSQLLDLAVSKVGAALP